MMSAKLKKIVAIIICFCLISTFSFNVAFASNETVSKTEVRDSKTDKLIEFLEKEKAKLRDSAMNELDKEIKRGNYEDNKEKVKEIKEKYSKKIKEKVEGLLLNNGFELVGNKEDVPNTNVNTYTSSNDIQLEDSIYYNSSNQLYDFEASWNFTDWDTRSDIEDFCAARMTNTTGYYVYSSYCTTYAANFTTYWDNVTSYTQSGSCSNGSSTSGSHVTKKYQDTSGVIYNIIDGYSKPYDTGVYYTDTGYISHYIKKTTGGVNQIFLDYNHNYQYITSQYSASIGYVGLDSISHALTVTYTTANGTWQRCSSGETIQ